MTFSSDPIITPGNGSDAGSVGTTARWANVGTADGVPIDLVVEVVGNNRVGDSLHFATTADGAEIRLRGAPGQLADVTYHFYQAGTTIGEVVDPTVLISDIDGRSNVVAEKVWVPSNGVESYSVAGPNTTYTGLIVSLLDNGTVTDVTDDSYLVSSSNSGNADDFDITVEFDFHPTTKVDVRYGTELATNRKFVFNASGGTVFSNPTTVHTGSPHAPDLTTNDTTPTFSGTTGEDVGTEVEVHDDSGALVCSATVLAATPDNTWSCAATAPIAEGIYTYTASTVVSSGPSPASDFVLVVDLDSDDDGIPDAVEGTVDTDGDGTPDFQDTDSDADGIPDAQENIPATTLSGADSDSDGLDDAVDVDQTGGEDLDGNGVDDRFEASDADGDGIPDYVDPDSDGDGIPDHMEGDATTDTDADGLADYKDTDADGDGVPDHLEASNMPPLSGNDSDFDGIDDLHDVDATGGVDSNGNGIDDNAEPVDTDGDGLADFADRDSDADGLPDALEAEMVALSGSDADGDGIDDALDVNSTGGMDVNADGIDDALAPADTDTNGLPDFIDPDSDGDGILDGTEAGSAFADADGDGIDNRFDVDSTGGSDSDGNGVDDSIAANDFDGDGVPNHRDYDSDNDGHTDVVEAGLVDENNDGFVDGGAPISTPRNTDGQDGPDYLDYDSNADGVLDITNSPASEFDLNGDGRIDAAYAVDTDGDGVPDLIDGNRSGPGVRADSDGDGIFDSVDLDDDNDGIPDRIEAPDGVDVDTDGDGLVDRLDADSDNDGIADTLEGSLDAFLDTDFDGLIDTLVDLDNDGLDDRIALNSPAPDHDGDGAADFRDLDSDNDSLSDLLESAGLQAVAIDANGDGRIDNEQDLDRDGLRDVVDAQVGVGTAGKALFGLDLDGDGVPNFRDLDSDGDGLSDELESGDVDGNNMPDSLETDDGLRTAVSGAGSMGFFLAVALGLRARRRNVLALCSVVAGVLGTTGAVQAASDARPAGHCLQLRTAETASVVPDAEGCWYAGVGINYSELAPEGEANNFSLDRDARFSSGFNVFVGRSLAGGRFVEFKYADLGGAGLGNSNPQIAAAFPNAEIEYRVPSLMVGQRWRRTERHQPFVKVGLSAITNSASGGPIPFDPQSTLQLAFGAGLMSQLGSLPYSVRAEVDWYDRDAWTLGLAVARDLGQRGAVQSRVAAIGTVDAIDDQAPAQEPRATAGESETTLAPASQVTARADVAAVAVSDVHEALQASRTLKLFFDVSERSVGEVSRSRINAYVPEILEKLRADQAAIVSIVGYADPTGEPQQNVALARSRAESVAQHLMRLGLPPQQIEIGGYGIAPDAASSIKGARRVEVSW